MEALMGFPSDNIAKVRARMNAKRTKAETDARTRLAEAYRRLPELKEIDAAFPRIGREIIAAVADSSDPEETARKIEALRKESEELENERAECLISGGFKPDHTKPRYECEKCNDTGYADGKMCECMRRECVLLGYESSGLGTLLSQQSFDTFSLKYYTGEDRYVAEQNLAACKGYVENFGKGSPSLLFMGDTGLGKTHLSTSIARALIDKGYDVMYVTSQGLLSVFGHERFERSYNVSEEKESERYFESELLIIDDLGTEEVNQFSVSCLYNLINTRTSRGLPTIINTNLKRDEIRARYTDRIASRLFGDFAVLAFSGRDIRMQKLAE